MIQTLDYFLPTDLTRCLIDADNGKLSYYTRTDAGQVHMISALSNIAWSETGMWTEFLIRRKWLCLICDTGNALVGVRYYTLSPGFWMPLECEVGWTKRFYASQVEHIGMDCQSMGVRRGPYRNSLVAHETIDFGGDIGVCDSITLEYHTGAPIYEHHTYARHPEYGALGLVRWTYPGFRGTTFNRIDYKPCKPLPVCGRSPL